MPAVVVTSLIASNALNYWYMNKKVTAVQKYDEEIFETWIGKLKNIGVKVTKNDKNADLVNEWYNQCFSQYQAFLMSHGYEYDEENSRYIDTESEKKEMQITQLSEDLKQAKDERKQLLLKIQQEKERRNKNLNNIGVVSNGEEENETFTNYTHDELTKVTQNLIQKGFKYTNYEWDHSAIQELKIVKQAFGYAKKMQKFLSDDYDAEVLKTAWAILGYPLTRKGDGYEYIGENKAILIRRDTALVARPPSSSTPVMIPSKSPQPLRHTQGTFLSFSEPILPASATNTQKSSQNKMRRFSPPPDKKKG